MDSAPEFVIHPGDSLAVLRTLPDASVHCCITSPPYYGLRDYGTGTWVGGISDCQHSVGGQVQDNKAPGAIVSGVRPGVNASVCRKCGATRVDQQIGLEPTPDAYISRLVEVFREVRRVLRDDGTLWVNIGDSYAGSWGAQGRQGKTGELAGRTACAERQIAAAAKRLDRAGSIPENSGLKPKDLIGIPWMLAFALRADGWWLRQDIIWHKPNPMPESVKDRCTKAHEYIFMLSKSARYWWDADGIREPSESIDSRASRSSRTFAGAVQRNRDLERYGTTRGRTNQSCCHPNGRNKRSVWTFNSLPTPDAHFATFPIELPETCLKAGSPEGGVVLDPFAGAGTTGLACLKNGRRFIGIELNPAYIEIALNRARRHYPLLLGATP